MSDFKQTIEYRLKRDGEHFFYDDVAPDGYEWDAVRPDYAGVPMEDKVRRKEIYDDYRQRQKAYKQSLWDKMSYTFEELDRTGGMDEGYNVSQIYKFTDKDTGEELYVDFYGHHISHDGSYYDGYRFVTPKQKTVTVYN